MKEYFATMEAQLQKWEADLAALAAEGQMASDGARAAYHERIKALRARRDAARQTFRLMRSSSAAAAEQMQGGMSAAWETLQKALQKAAEELRK